MEKKCCRVCLKEIRYKATFTDIMLAPDPVVYLRDGKVPATSYLHCYYFCLKPNSVNFNMENLDDYLYICGPCKTLLMKAVGFIIQSQKNEIFLNEMYDIRKNENVFECSDDFITAFDCGDGDGDGDVATTVEDSRSEVVLIKPNPDEREMFENELDEIETAEQKFELEEDINEYEYVENNITEPDTEYLQSGDESFNDEEVSYENLDSIINDTRKKICKDMILPDKDVEYTNEDESYDELEEMIKAVRKKVLRNKDNEERIIKGSSKKRKKVNTVEVDNERWKVVPRKSFNHGFKCIICRKHFDIQRHLFDHYDNEHDQSSLIFPCDICQWRSISYKAMIFHKYRVHKNTECEDCDMCGQAVLPAGHKAHKERHKSHVQYACLACDRVFNRLCTMKQHYRATHENKMRRYECPDCDRYFFSEEKLDSHRRGHNEDNDVNEAEFLCHICSKTFPDKSYLLLHMKVHNGNIFNCPQCGKKFIRQQAMEYHMRSHAKDYPYECNFCSQRFGTWANMDAHVKRHKGIQYRCKLCDKRFINLSGITRHSYKHLGYPLYCKLCGKGFAVIEKLRRHFKSIHGKQLEDDASEVDIEAYIRRHRVPNVSDIREECMEE